VRFARPHEVAFRKILILIFSFDDVDSPFLSSTLL
jgi:hypothetical protein